MIYASMYLGKYRNSPLLRVYLLSKVNLAKKGGLCSTFGGIYK